VPADRSFNQPKQLPDGSLQYEKGWEPPPPHPGFKPDEKDKWHLIPLWPECPARVQTSTMRPCGCVLLKMICTQQGCHKNGQQVTPDDCRGCPWQQGLEVEKNETSVDLGLGE
jgi:hypothetical protein